MFNTQLSAEQRLEKATIKIMGHPKYRWLSGVLMIGERKIIEEMPPGYEDKGLAYTNGRDEYYLREFVESMSDPELRFVILHEVYHKMYGHLTNWRWMFERHPDVANWACDFVINVKLYDDNKDDGFAKMPKVGLLDEKYRGYDSAQVFHELMKNAKPCPKCGDGSEGSGDDSLPPQPGCPSCQGQGWDVLDVKGAQSMSEKEVQDLKRELDRAIRQGAVLAGKDGTGGHRDLGELTEPQINWRDVLREFVQETCAGKDFSTWKRPNRRFVGGGYYMPSGVSEKIGEIVVAVDTSGSIGPAELNAMLSEVKSVAMEVHPEAVRMLYWDTGICADERFEGPEVERLVESTKPAGGGGTNVECVPNYMRKERINAQCAIIFTDGYLGGGWGQWDCPTLWVIIDNKECTAANGRTVHVKTGGMG
jgi:predicted metal-dependent peptidase